MHGKIKEQLKRLYRDIWQWYGGIQAGLWIGTSKAQVLLTTRGLEKSYAKCVTFPSPPFIVANLSISGASSLWWKAARYGCQKRSEVERCTVHVHGDVGRRELNVWDRFLLSRAVIIATMLSRSVMHPTQHREH
jgi:hypothetical protein